MTAEGQLFSETQASLFSEVEGDLLAKLREPSKAAARRIDLLLQLEDRVEQSFRSRRATWNVNINRDHLIHALHDRVVVEDAA